MSHNWIAHLNAVAPQWPLRRRKPLDKSRSDIALLIFASIQALPEPAGIVGFILLCHNKNNRPMKHPPEGVGGGFWNNFQLCPSVLRHCSIVLCWWDFIGFCRVETHEIMCLEWLISATMDSKWGLLYCAAPVAWTSFTEMFYKAVNEIICIHEMVGNKNSTYLTIATTQKRKLMTWLPVFYALISLFYL